MKQSYTLASLLCFYISISGCGGGGSSSGSSANTVNFSTSQSSISFSAEYAQLAPPPATMRGSISGNPDGDLYIVVDLTRASFIADFTLTPQSNSAATLEFHPYYPAFIGLGEHQGEITIRACGDIDCNSEYSGSPLIISANYEILPPVISFSSNPLEIQTREGSQSIPTGSVDVNISSGSWALMVADSDANEWLTPQLIDSAQPNTEVNFAGGILPQGMYSTDVLFTDNSGGTTETLAVNYTVQPSEIGLSSFPISLNLNQDSTPTDLSQSYLVTSNVNEDFVWQATTNAPWLTLPITMDDTSATSELVLELNDELKNLPTGTYNSSITITSEQAGIQDYHVPVSLTQELPVVHFVTPNTQFLNDTSDIVIRGYGFNSITNERLWLGNIETDQFTVVNDTQINVSPPALALGDHKVRLENNAEIDLSRASISTVSTPAYTQELLTTPGSKRETIYDTIRESIYVVNYDNDSIERFAFNGSTWVNDVIEFPLQVWPITVFLSPDSTKLIVNTVRYSGLTVRAVSGDTVLRTIDLDTFTLDEERYYAEESFFTGAMTNNGELLLAQPFNNTDLERFDWLSKEFLPTPTSGVERLRASTAVTSGNGIIAYFGASNLRPSIKVYNSQTREMSALQIDQFVEHLSTNHDGSFILVNNEVYTPDEELVGSLPESQVYALSPSRSRAYTISSSRELQVYDLNATDGSGQFQQIGSSILLLGNEEPYYMTITQNDTHALITTETSVVVQPLP